MKHLNLKKLTENAQAQTVVVSDVETSAGQKLVGQNGEFNAVSQKQVNQVVASLLQSGANYQVESAAERQEAFEFHRSLVCAAMDKGNAGEARIALTTIAEAVTQDVAITSNRDGFMRRMLSRLEITPGNKPEIRVNQKAGQAIVATGINTIAPSVYRDNMIYPQEFYIQHRPFIEEKDIVSTTTDLLDEKFRDSLEAFMVTEDKLWKQAADRAVAALNGVALIGSTLTPRIVANQMNRIASYGLSATTCLMANDVITDIIADDSWTNKFNATSVAEEVVQTGSVGQLLGLEILTDSFRHLPHKVLEQGEMYFVTSPDEHGRYSDRGGVSAAVLDSTNVGGIPGKGWDMSQLTSITVVNNRTVTKAIRG